jgi:hypothetical protein
MIVSRAMRTPQVVKGAAKSYKKQKRQKKMF